MYQENAETELFTSQARRNERFGATLFDQMTANEETSEDDLEIPAFLRRQKN